MTEREDMPDDVNILAGEYVLGLMDIEDARRFEKRVETEPAARQALARERARFLELDVGVAPASPSGDLWRRIEAGLDAVEAEPPRVVDLAARRKAPSRSARPAPGGFWRGFAAASVAAAVLAAAAVFGFGLNSGEPRLLVVLLDAQSNPVSIVEAIDSQRIRVIPLVDIDVPAGKTLEVWTLPDRETGPVSMGLLERVRAMTLTGPELPDPKPDQLYEITVEPAGGSPTGKPTGPIVGKGFARVPQI